MDDHRYRPGSRLRLLRPALERSALVGSRMVPRIRGHLGCPGGGPGVGGHPSWGSTACRACPFTGAWGDREWRPTVASQVQRDYRLAIGNMTVDLRNVRFPAGSTSVTASVDVGHLLVEVPPRVDVGVNADSVIGAVVYGDGQGDAGAGSLGTGSPGISGSASGPHLNMTVTAGVGVVQLARGQGGNL